MSQNEKDYATGFKQVTVCTGCRKTTLRKDSLSDFKLKDENGKYCRYCKNCEDKFNSILAIIDDPTGVIFDEGVEVDLGDKDPFFKIRFIVDENPGWKIIPLDEEVGGLLVFVRKVGPHMESIKGKRPKVKTKIIVTKKSTRVAFAEPYTGGEGDKQKPISDIEEVKTEEPKEGKE